MGGCGSRPGTPEEREANKKISQMLQKDAKTFKRETRILLLGAGESGKSTFFKQMKILSSNNKFSDEELRSYLPLIHTNILSQLRILLRQADHFGYKLNEDNQSHETEILEGDQMEMTPELAQIANNMWNDPAIQDSFKKRHLFVLNDSCQFFLSQVLRYADPDYLPTLEDVLRVRRITTGVEEAEFDVKNCAFRMIDVGGQRNERRKWLHCLDCVTAVIFFVSMSEYNQTLVEDEKTNRMTESLTLFEGISNSSWFSSVSMIIFFNKYDLFVEKIKTVDLKVCFPEYSGGCDKEAAQTYIKKEFLTRSPMSMVYTHFTVAVDTNNISLVFEDVKTSALWKSLEQVL